jgi:predicted Holliday junction resolvase-like endonuclease
MVVLCSFDACNIELPCSNKKALREQHMKRIEAMEKRIDTLRKQAVELVKAAVRRLLVNIVI